LAKASEDRGVILSGGIAGFAMPESKDPYSWNAPFVSGQKPVVPEETIVY
jgi:hypothetical protein